MRCQAYLLAALLVLALPFCGWATSDEVSTATQVSSGFESGGVGAFSMCTTKYPNSVVPLYLPGSGINSGPVSGNFCQKHVWITSSFNEDDRLTKGAEACTPLAVAKDGWYGFSFYLPDPGFTLTGSSHIAQVFQNATPDGRGCSSWAALLGVEQNNLVIYHRSFCGTPTIATVATNLPRNTWISVIMHVRASHLGAGKFQIWYNGAPENAPSYDYTGNFGFGIWDSNDALVITGADANPLTYKIGMYTSPSSVDEVSKTIYYDNICQLAGNPANAFAQANPANTTNPPRAFAYASNQSPGEGAIAAFDGSITTKWLCPTTNGAAVLAYFFGGEARVVTQYGITSGNDVPARDPKNWQFQGSQDGNAWTTLDTQTNQLFSSRGQTRQFPIGNTAAYRYYRLNITANNGDGGSIQLSELSFTTGNGLPPTAPAGLAAAPVSATQVSLSWQAASGATSYTVRRAPASDGPFVVASSGLTGLAYVDSGLSAATDYYYEVSSLNSGGESAPSPALKVTTPASDGSTTYPAENAAWGGGTVLETTHAGFNGTGYVNFPSSGGWLEFANVNGGGGGNATVFIRHALASGSRVGTLWVNGVSQSISFASTGAWTNWTVKTVNVPLNSGPTNILRFQSGGQDLANIDEITVRPTPAAPGGLVAAAVSGNQINLSWSAALGAASYQVERSTNGTNGFSLLASNLASPAGSDAGLAYGATWFYRVSAVNLSGTSPASNTASATTYTQVQAWRSQYFGTIENVGAAADEADPDGDAMTNAQEFVSGTIPTSSASVFKVTEIQRTPEGVTLKFTTELQKTYRVEGSATLQADSWTVVQDNIAGTGALMSYLIPAAALGDQRFFRIVVR